MSAPIRDPYAVARTVPVGDTGLVLTVGNLGTTFKLENASGSVVFDADAVEQLAMVLRRTALTTQRQWGDPPSYRAKGGAR
jgi:hypothetical protein